LRCCRHSTCPIIRFALRPFGRCAAFAGVILRPRFGDQTRRCHGRKKNGVILLETTIERIRRPRRKPLAAPWSPSMDGVMPSSGIPMAEGSHRNRKHTIRREEESPPCRGRAKLSRQTSQVRSKHRPGRLGRCPKAPGSCFHNLLGCKNLGISSWPWGVPRLESGGQLRNRRRAQREWRPRRGDVWISTSGSTSTLPGILWWPLVNAQGKVVGINTRGLARGRASRFPNATVNRLWTNCSRKATCAALSWPRDAAGHCSRIIGALSSRPR